MNFFFGMKHLNFYSEIQIPCFQNRNPKSKKLLLYEAWTENNQWVINRLNDCKLNDDFYIVKNNIINNKKIFFLANEKDIDRYVDYLLEREREEHELKARFQERMNGIVTKRDTWGADD